MPTIKTIPDPPLMLICNNNIKSHGSTIRRLYIPAVSRNISINPTLIGKSIVKWVPNQNVFHHIPPPPASRSVLIEITNTNNALPSSVITQNQICIIPNLVN